MRAGRIIGALLIIQMAGSGLVNFVLAVFLALTIQALWLGIAVTALPVLVQRTRTLMLWLVALAVVGLTVAVVENIGVLSIVSLGEVSSQASPMERERLESVRVVVASTRDWAHYMGRMCDGVMAFVFYLALFRFALVPRAIAGFGLVAAPLMIAGIATSFFGHDVIFPMLAPLGLSQLALAVWLMTKGLGACREQPEEHMLRNPLTS